MKQLKFLKVFISAIVLVMVAGSVLTGVDMFSVLYGSGGLVLSMAASGAIVDDTVTVEAVKEGAPNVDEPDYDKLIVEMLPSRTPLDTIFRNRAKKRKAESLEVRYFEVDTKPFKDTVKTANTVGDAQTIDLAVDDIDMWDSHDTLKLVGVKGYVYADSLNTELTFNNLVARVLSKDNTAGTLKLQALNGYYTGGKKVFHDNIAEDTVLVRLGKAESELAMQTTPYAMLPFENYNYCQNFMAQIEESTWQNIHKKRVDWGFSDYARLNIYDMRATKELSFLFGTRSADQDAVTKDMIFTCGGISQFLTKSTTVGSTVTINDFATWRAMLFEDNNGSEVRHAFIGSTLWKKLETIDHIQKQLAANQTEVVFGIRFAKIEFGNEVIYLHKHNLMSLAGWDDYAMFLDLQHIHERPFIPLKETELDLRTSGQRNAKAKVLTEVTCPIVKYPATHLIVKPA